MKTETVWLKISIFNSKEYWHTVLLTINAFIQAFSSYSLKHKVKISFNYVSGENIRVSVLNNKKDALQLAKNIDCFLKKNVLIRKSNESYPLSLTGLFLPIRETKICYGLYRETDITDQYVNLNAAVSDVILSELSAEPITDATILSFAFYMHAAVLINFSDQIPDELQNYYNYKPLLLLPNALNIEFVAQQYETCKKDLVAILEELNSNFYAAECTLGLSRWVHFVKANMESKSEVFNLILNYSRIAKSIDDNLALNCNSRLLVYYIITHFFFTK